MANFISKSLKVKLITLFFLVSIIPIAIVGYLSYISGKTALHTRLIDSLTAIAKSRETAVMLYLEAKAGRTVDFASDGFIRDSFVIYQNMGVSIIGERGGVIAGLNQHINKNKMPLDKEIYGINIIDLNGHVMASTMDSEIGMDESESDYFLKTKDLDYGNTFISDIAINDHFSEKIPAFTVSAPLTDKNKGVKLGVIVNYYKTTTLNLITTDREGMGKTGEVYIVNKDKMIITESRFLEDAVLKQKVDTEPVNLFQNERKLMTGIYPDYRGIPIVGSSSGANINKEFGFGWTLLAEIDEDEAFEPIGAMGLWTILTSIPVIIAVLLTAYFISRRIANPIRKISEQVVKVGDGDLSVDVIVEDRADEIGTLTQSFQRMVKNLRGLAEQVKEGANVLASSASEILATSTQLASASAETATAVSQTTTTAEEVKQTAQVSTQKARNVSEMAQKAAQISLQGKQSTDEVIEGMDRIKEQMESIAESIVRLSDQSQAIGEIIATVDDIAEQSNLLAVNAAIEAARAGEQGKGFAVVAQEVRNLATQSKKATAQVKNILNEIQKATSSAVMVTEQGSKAVESGVKQSLETGKAIITLTNSITEASQAGIQIVASNQQQLTGMEQVVSAIENIKNASNQSADATKHLELAAQNLDKLGQKLIALVERYRM